MNAKVITPISTGLCSRDAAAKPYKDVFTGALWKYERAPEHQLQPI